MNSEASPDRQLSVGDIQIRSANVNDAGVIARIYNFHIDLGGATFDTEHWETEFVARLVHCSLPEAWFVATCHGDSTSDEEVVGWASARRHSLRHGYRFTCETAIYLTRQAMGCGIGDLLQQRLETHCRESGIHHAIAKIIADNERSIAFHRRFGYELVGIQKEIGHMGGEWRDVAILQRIF
ncbi:MAG: GNAT family N-acetyltransferase [Rubripirellula sp.]